MRRFVNLKIYKNIIEIGENKNFLFQPEIILRFRPQSQGPKKGIKLFKSNYETSHTLLRSIQSGQEDWICFRSH